MMTVLFLDLFAICCLGPQRHNVFESLMCDSPCKWKRVNGVLLLLITGLRDEKTLYSTFGIVILWASEELEE